MRNIDKFLTELKELNFSPDDYLIVSSGSLAIHNIRECGDLDIIISDKLFANLSEKYPVEIGEYISKIRIGYIEFIHRNKQQDDEYDFDRQRVKAEMVDGIPFQDLESCFYFKEKGSRDKDKKDVELIKQFLSK
jgi:hypothetical protein